jgi:hypothetical protein
MTEIKMTQQGNTLKVTAGPGSYFVLDTDTSPEDAALWHRLFATAVRHCASAGDLSVIDLVGVGRAVTSRGKGTILFQPYDREEFLRRIPKFQPDAPVLCPFCGGTQLSEIDAERPTVDGASGIEIQEWQCRSVCGGRSFWV